jgi:hypothetical protein
MGSIIALQIHPVPARKSSSRLWTCLNFVLAMDINRPCAVELLQLQAGRGPDYPSQPRNQGGVELCSDTEEPIGLPNHSLEPANHVQRRLRNQQGHRYVRDHIHRHRDRSLCRITLCLYCIPEELKRILPLGT